METKKVLIAEDEAMIAAMWREAFSLHDCEVVLAKNGLDAIEILGNQSFDLLITDLRMPEKDGYALIKHIEEKRINLPIVVCSGYIEDEALLNQNASVKLLLKKPVDIGKEVQNLIQEINPKPNS
ncbi:MAG: response regulator [Vicingaceae bacterium]